MIFVLLLSVVLQWSCVLFVMVLALLLTGSETGIPCCL